MDNIETCCKCMTPVGSDAVFLKNGTHMCPACYQRAYPVKKRERLPNIHISVEGVIAIIVVSGVLVLGYKAFHFVANMRREEALLAQQAQEAQDKRRHEEFLASEERRKAADAERKGHDARRDATRQAEAERSKQADAQRAEQQRKKQLEAQDAAALREKESRDANILNAVNAARERADEIASLGKDVAEAKRKINKAESEKTELRKKIGIYTTGLNRAKEIKDTLLAQYRIQFPQSPATLEDVPGWRRPPPAKTAMLGRIPVTQSRADEYQVLVTKFDNAAGDVRSNTEHLKRENANMKILESEIAHARATLITVNRKLKALNATPGEFEETGISEAKAALPSKVITKKDGSQIRTSAIMSVDNEVRYKDDEGQWKTIDKDEVAKIE